MTDISIQFGRFIHQERRKRFITQEWLAKKVDISRMTLIQLEKCRASTSLNTADSLLRALSLNWRDFNAFMESDTIENRLARFDICLEDRNTILSILGVETKYEKAL